MLKRLWADEGGAILSAELILIMTMLVIGLITGLHAVQKAVVSELADVAQAIGALNQSYAFTGFKQEQRQSGSPTAFLSETEGSYFQDALDLDDEGSIQVGGVSQGIVVIGWETEGADNGFGGAPPP